MLGIGSEYTLMGHSLVPQIKSSSPVLKLAPWLQVRQRHVRKDFLAKAPHLWHCIRELRLMTLPNEGLVPRDLYLGSMMWIHASKCTNTTMAESASKTNSNTASISRPI